MSHSDMLRHSWPKVFIPSIEREIPPLSLNAQSGRALLSDNPFRMYICGITPYDATHLGHAATYLTYDLVLRYMSAMGAEVNFAENITDIDEPLLERANRDGVDWQELADSQIELFASDMTALHIQAPQSFVPVTKVMPLVESAISRMKANGFVYAVDQDLYFDISSFLPRLPVPLDEALAIFAERGGDPSREGKRHPLDPVLWLAQRDGEPGWESAHGVGRPGWHIECAVIALTFLTGEDFSGAKKSENYSIALQGGGSDLIFPHHFMSGAQAEAITGIPFAKEYVHTALVGLDGEKMSKSKGNLVFVSRLLGNGVDPMAIRWALLSTHYQQERMWIPGAMSTYVDELVLVRTALSREEVLPTEGVITKIIDSMANNLDTPSALSAIKEWASQTLVAENPSQRGAGELSRTIDALLGIAL